MGLSGLSRRAREVWMRLAIISRPWRWPTTRPASVSTSFRTASTSFLTMRPTGTPVQSDTTAATAWASTLGRISGASPCALASVDCSSRSSVSRASRTAGSLASVSSRS